MPVIRFVDDIYSKTDPGNAKYFTVNGVRGGINIRCPGCGALSPLPFRPTEGPGPSWDWDGNENLPTLTPSIWHNVQGCGWHGHLIMGRFASC
jgi:hypothetical protein